MGGLPDRGAAGRTGASRWASAPRHRQRVGLPQGLVGRGGGGFGFYTAPSDFREAQGRAGTPARGPSLPRKSPTGRDL